MNSKRGYIIGGIIITLLIVVSGELGFIIYARYKDDLESSNKNKAQVVEQLVTNQNLDSEKIQEVVQIDRNEETDSLRDIVGDKESYLENEVVIGPVKVFENDVQDKRFGVKPSTGEGKWDYDRDVEISVFYNAVRDIEEWRNLRSQQHPVIYVKGIVSCDSNDSSVYIKATAIAHSYEEIMRKESVDLQEVKGEALIDKNEITSVPPEKEGVVYKTYINARFGFSIEYPDIFTEQVLPTNNDGILLSNPDKQLSLVVSGCYNVLEETAVGNYQSDMNSLENINYHYQKDDWYVISWSEGDTMFYKKMIVGIDQISTFIINYPVDDASQYDQIVEHLFKTFSA